MCIYNENGNYSKMEGGSFLAENLEVGLLQGAYANIRARIQSSLLTACLFRES